MRGREVGDGQGQGCGRGREPAEVVVVVGGGRQVLFGESHRTAAAVAAPAENDRQEGARMSSGDGLIDSKAFGRPRAAPEPRWKFPDSICSL